MKEEKIRRINNLLFEFMPLYHQKFAVGFQRDDGIEPKCSKNQLRTLFIAKREQEILPTDLGKCLDMQKGSLTTLIDSLEEMKLVQRVRDPQDRRKTWVSLTEKGEKYVAAKREALEGHFQELFQAIPDEQIDEFVKSLDFIVEFMDKL